MNNCCDDVITTTLNAFNMMRFMYRMTLMRTCAAYDFSMRDVFKPTGPRTKRFLSAIINFVKVICIPVLISVSVDRL